MLTRNEEKLLRGLSQRKIRQAEGCFTAEGLRLVEDLLASTVRIRLFAHSSHLEDSGRGRALLHSARQRGIRTESIAHDLLQTVADTQTPQGVIAIAEFPKPSLADLTPSSAEPVGLLVLDAVQDPGNFGTLARTAEALGAAAVLMLPGTVDPWNPKSVRSAMGASFRIPLVATSWTVAEPWLREHAFDILAATADGESGIPSPVSRVALVVGNEASGISADTRRVADQLIAIPLRGRAESLNVSAAAAILLHTLLK